MHLFPCTLTRPGDKIFGLGNGIVRFRPKGRRVNVELGRAQAEFERLAPRQEFTPDEKSASLVERIFFARPPHMCNMQWSNRKIPPNTGNIASLCLRRAARSAIWLNIWGFGRRSQSSASRRNGLLWTRFIFRYWGKLRRMRARRSPQYGASVHDKCERSMG